jgi:hypothetical protein
MRRDEARGGVEVRLGLLRAYYWATPLFLMVDALWGISVRASFLPKLEQRLVYYAFCLCCAWMCQAAPSKAPWVGMGESAVNLFLLILGVMLPILNLPEAVVSGGPLPELMTPGRLMNVALSGGMLILSFQRSQAAVARDPVGSRIAGSVFRGFSEP